MHIAPGVETVSELEVLHCLNVSQASDPSYIGTPLVLVVDSRTPEWIARGTSRGRSTSPGRS